MAKKQDEHLVGWPDHHPASLVIAQLCHSGWEVTEGSYFLDVLRSTEGNNFLDLLIGEGGGGEGEGGKGGEGEGRRAAARPRRGRGGRGCRS